MYKYADDEYLLVVNAANTDKDFKWMIDNKKDFNIIIENISDQIGEVAIQGPKSEKNITKVNRYRLIKDQTISF